MSKALLFSDLDNTLIYSHRHEDEYIGKKIWVEELDGHRQSFMTEITYSWLLSQDKYELIPVTTRNRKQFGRLESSLSKLYTRDVLICNGAILLHDGQEDTEWRKESEEIVRPSLGEYHEMLSYAKKMCGDDNVISEGNFLFYIKTKEPASVFEELKSVSKGYLAFSYVSSKVYGYPQENSKGRAIQRYMKRYGKKPSVAMGDSDMDISMLSAVDIAICPSKLIQKTEKKCLDIGEAPVSSDVACGYLERLK